MRNIDLLSRSPRIFIFGKKADKTTFGGVLTIIYLLILILISFAYIYNFEEDMKYIISYGYFVNPANSEDEIKKSEDPLYNPTLKFMFDILDMNYQPLSDNFVLFDRKSGNLIKRNRTIELNVSNIDIFVLYKCSDMSCSIHPQDEKQYQGIYYHLNVSNSYFEFNLQDEEEPIKESEYYSSCYIFNHDIPQRLTIFWQAARVVEEKGMIDNFFGTEKVSYGGSFYRTVFSVIKKSIIDVTEKEEYNFTGIYKPIFNFVSDNNYLEYEEYKRKKVSAFDMLANICSLCSTIYNGFRFAFVFLYSENFDNYKIIDRILSSKDSNEKTMKKMNDIKLDNFFPLLKEDDNNNEKRKENEETHEIIEDKESKRIKLPKFRFYSYILNIFSCLFSKKNITQQCISICNKIVQKYKSIETIVYNQFMIENLFNDYKWNNPELKSIYNIELIDKLNNIINDEG